MRSSGSFPTELTCFSSRKPRRSIIPSWDSWALKFFLKCEANEKGKPDRKKSEPVTQPQGIEIGSTRSKDPPHSRTVVEAVDETYVWILWQGKCGLGHKIVQ